LEGTPDISIDLDYAIGRATALFYTQNPENHLQGFENKNRGEGVCSGLVGAQLPFSMVRC
jgi:hypothetical protein